jgi:hypothetical protein
MNEATDQEICDVVNKLVEEQMLEIHGGDDDDPTGLVPRPSRQQVLEAASIFRDCISDRDNVFARQLGTILARFGRHENHVGDSNVAPPTAAHHTLRLLTAGVYSHSLLVHVCAAKKLRGETRKIGGQKREIKINCATPDHLGIISGSLSSSGIALFS